MIFICAIIANILIFLHAQSVTQVPLYRNNTDNPLGLSFSYKIEFDDRRGNFGARITVRSAKKVIDEKWSLLFKFPVESQRILDAGAFQGRKIIPKGKTDSRTWYRMEPIQYEINPEKNIINSLVFKGAYDTKQGNPLLEEIVFQIGNEKSQDRAMFKVIYPELNLESPPLYPNKEYINSMKKKYGYDQMIVMTIIVPCIVLIGTVVVGISFWFKIVNNREIHEGKKTGSI